MSNTGTGDTITITCSTCGAVAPLHYDQCSRRANPYQITIGSTSITYPSRWCGQDQPHHPHTWTTQDNLYANCGGHS